MIVRNPLAPLERIIALIGGFMLLALVSLPLNVMSDGSAWGFGQRFICVDAPIGVFTSGSGAHNVTAAHVRTLETGVDAAPSGFELCTRDPNLGQQTLSTLIDLPTFLFALGFVVITWRLTRRVRRRGLFMPEVASSLGRLSIYLFVGEFGVAAIQGLAAQGLVSTMLTEHDTYIGGYYHLSWAVIIAAFGLQAMSRVMAATVPMREELDATV
jgi:Protein of unknown function (DUF2975)